jgi:catechol 2,3-dioxygenase-like lactoylglutathione lyase family enzyme
MFKPKGAFSGFSVDDLAKAKEFYTKTLGLTMTEEGAGARLQLPGGTTVFTYPKSDHKAATFTILNFQVDDIDEAVDELTSRGIRFHHYENSDPKGVMRGKEQNMGPNIAWFNDPAGNFLAVLED